MFIRLLVEDGFLYVRKDHITSYITLEERTAEWDKKIFERKYQISLLNGKEIITDFISIDLNDEFEQSHSD